MNGFKRVERCFLKSRFTFYLLFLSFSLCAVGCVSSYAEHLRGVRRDYYEFGDVERAKQDVEKRRNRASQRERDVLTLNEASLDLCSGNVEGAKQKLLEARDSFDRIEEELLQQSAENLLTYWTDENARSYEGEDYEKVLVRAQLAIADLLDEGEDARAYAYQTAAKQDEITKNGLIDDPRNQGKKINLKGKYPRIPLGPYIEGLLWEETFINANDAARCYEKVVAWNPNFQQGKRDLVRAQTSVHSKPGNGRVYIFAFVGKGPHKEQIYEEATQFSLLLADQIFSAANKYSVPPTLAPVPIPALVVEEPSIASIKTTVDGKVYGYTETLTDVNDMAIRQYEATKDLLIARAVVRRVVKKGTIYAAKQAGQVNEWVNLAMDVGGIVWEATETADTRCWGLLPAKIQVASFEVPAGKRRLVFTPCDVNGNKIGAQVEVNVNVSANRNN